MVKIGIQSNVFSHISQGHSYHQTWVFLVLNSNLIDRLVLHPSLIFTNLFLKSEENWDTIECCLIFSLYPGKRFHWIWEYFQYQIQICWWPLFPSTSHSSPVGSHYHENKENWATVESFEFFSRTDILGPTIRKSRGIFTAEFKFVGWFFLPLLNLR